MLDLEEIYRTYYDRVYGYMAARLNNHHEAEDLAADVFCKVAEKAGEYSESKASVSTWIFTISRNRLIDHYRTSHSSEEIPEDLTKEGEVDKALLTQETLSELAGALASLGERERDLIIMHYYENKTLKEIALILNISYVYAKVLHGKALKRLGEVMAEKGIALG